jgi:hypothetical protein
MAVRKEDLHQLVNRLHKQNQKMAYEFLQYLVSKQEDNPYLEIRQREPDNIQMNEEEWEQFQDKEFVSWEEVKRDLNL